MFPSSSYRRFLAVEPDRVVPQVLTNVCTFLSRQPYAMMSVPSSVAVIVIDEPRSCGHWVMRFLSGNFCLVFLHSNKEEPSTAQFNCGFFTEANHESPHTMRPLPCHCSLKQSFVAVPAPSSHCHRFFFIASFPSLISALIIILDATSVSVFTSHPTPLGFLFIFHYCGHTTQNGPPSIPGKHGLINCDLVAWCKDLIPL